MQKGTFFFAEVEGIRIGARAKGGEREERSDREGEVDITIPHIVRPYSVHHELWTSHNEGRDVRSHTLEYITFIGYTVRTPEGNIGVHCTPTDTSGNILASYTANRPTKRCSLAPQQYFCEG